MVTTVHIAQSFILTFGRILQGLIMYLDESAIEELRNLYVQFDNVNSHKSYTLAADFSALIDLSICKNAKSHILM